MPKTTAILDKRILVEEMIDYIPFPNWEDSQIESSLDNIFNFYVRYGKEKGYSKEKRTQKVIEMLDENLSNNHLKSEI